MADKKTTVPYGAAADMMTDSSEKIFIDEVRTITDDAGSVKIYILDPYIDVYTLDERSQNFRLNVALLRAMGKENFSVFGTEHCQQYLVIPIAKTDRVIRDQSIMQDYEAGMSSAMIAKKQGMTAAAVRQVIRRQRK